MAAIVARDQARQGGVPDDRPAGLRVVNPDALPMPAADLSKVPGAETYAQLARDERVAMAVALRAAGCKVGRIAQILHVSPATVKDYLAAAREWGALDDVVRDIEYRLVPQAVENVAHFLDKKDKDVTLEVLKGRGVFRTFGNTKVEGAMPNMNLQVAFVNAPAVPVVDALETPILGTGEVVGTPRE